MERTLLVLFLVAAMAAWCPPSSAEQVIAPSGALNATGVLQGVDMIGQGAGGTLTVGDQDIFTNNSGGPYVGATAVTTDVNSVSNIVFGGSSSVFGDIGSATGPLRFLDIDAGAAGETVSFFGSVYGTTLDITGTGTVSFLGGPLSTNLTAADFDGDGTLILAPNTLLTGAVTNNTAQTGTLVLGSGSQVTGAVGGAIGLRAINVVGGSDTAGVSATIDGAANAYAFNLGTNTLNLTGALSIANGGPAGVINTTVASDSVFGHIVTAGAASFTAVQVNVMVPASSFLTPGTQWDIVDPISGSNGSIVTVMVQAPTNPLYTFAPVPPAGTVAGRVTIELTGIPLQAAPDPVVEVLLGIDPLTPDLIAILAAINALTDPVAVADAVAQFNPSTSSLAAPLVTFQGTRRFQDLWLSRLDLCRRGSRPDAEKDEANPDCDDDPSHGWWLRGFGDFGEQSARRESTGYESRVLGSMIAYDAPLGHHTRAGLGFGFARSDIDGKKYDDRTDIKTYRGVAYVGHERGPWFVHGSGSFGWNDYSNKRRIEFPGVSRKATADYDGQDYTAYLSTGLNFDAVGFTLTPLASLQYSRVNVEDYTEKGAGDLNLMVDSQGYNFLESGLGGKLERPVDSEVGTLVPEIHFNWFHEILNPRLEQDSAFVAGGSSFETKGLKTKPDLFNVGGGLTFVSCECGWRKWSIEAVYDFDWRMDDYRAHEGALRFTHRF